MTKKHLLIILVLVLFGLPALGYLSNATPNFRRATFLNKISPSSGEGTTFEFYEDAVQTEPAIGRVGGPVGSDVTSSLILPPEPPIYDEGFTPDIDRTIVKTASLGIVVEDTNQTVNQVKQIAEQAGGLITNTNVYEADFARGVARGGINADITLRVPVEKLDQTLEEIKQVATRVTNESISAQDRTEQKVDLEAQLRNLRATEEQFLEILQDARTVQDTLTVQRELNNIRSQIERLQAQVDNIEGAAAMSTINVSITTRESELPFVDPGQNSIIDELKTAAREAISLYRSLFISGLRLTIIGLPAIIVLAIIYLFSRRKK